MIDIVIPCMDPGFIQLDQSKRNQFWLQFSSLKDQKIIVLSSRELNQQYHAEEILKKEAPGCNVLILEGQPQGALCTALMAIAEIKPNETLAVYGTSSCLSVTLQTVLEDIDQKNADAELVTFTSHDSSLVHVKKENGQIIEATRGRQISDQAAAELYVYRKAEDFIESAEKAILKGSSYQNQYYLDSSVNEMILAGKKISYLDAVPDVYHAFNG